MIDKVSLYAVFPDELPHSMIYLLQESGDIVCADCANDMRELVVAGESLWDATDLSCDSCGKPLPPTKELGR